MSDAPDEPADPEAFDLEAESAPLEEAMRVVRAHALATERAAKRKVRVRKRRPWITRP